MKSPKRHRKLPGKDPSSEENSSMYIRTNPHVNGRNFCQTVGFNKQLWPS
jgi:hypothetical protein